MYSISQDLEKGANFHSRQMEGELLKKGKFVFTIENISNMMNHQHKIKFSRIYASIAGTTTLDKEWCQLTNLASFQKNTCSYKPNRATTE